ncbi:MAG: hypothetical protein NZ958_03185 [Bacteroidia bacterium]|nr:hypothetical protein [Bacteroidia bacterium]
MNVWGWGVVAVGVGAAAAWWSYSRLAVQLPRAWRYGLGALRALAIAALVFLLGEPAWSRKVARTLPPRVVVVADNSQSVVWGDCLTVAAYQQGVRALVQALRQRGVEVIEYLLEERVRRGDSLTGQGQASPLAEGLATVLQQEPQAAAVLLISDGRETGEPLPLSSAVPVWTLAVGPTPPPDAVLESVEVPPWLREKQPIQLRVRLHTAGSPAVLTVTFPGGRQRLPLLASERTVLLNLSPLPAGLHKVQLQLEVAGDPNPANNVHTLILSVASDQPTFYLWAGEITPDIAFLRRLLEKIGPVRLIAARKPSGYTLNPETLITTPHSVHVLYNFPARPEDEVWLNRLFRENRFLLAIWGAVTLHPEQLRELGWEEIGPLLPYTLFGGPTVYAHTGHFAATVRPIEIGWPFPIGYKYYRGNKLLTAITGEGWWQLRAYPTLLAQWDSLISALVQEGLLFQRSQLAFAPRRLVFAPGEAITWRGYLPPGTAFYFQGRQWPVQTAPDGLTEAVAVVDSAGTYTYALRRGDSVVAAGYVVVSAFSRELRRLGRDTTYLAYLARTTGGKMLLWEARHTLPAALLEAVPAQRLLSLQHETIPFHEWGLWLGLILFLLCAEWLLRRYVGLY